MNFCADGDKGEIVGPKACPEGVPGQVTCYAIQTIQVDLGKKSPLDPD